MMKFKTLLATCALAAGVAFTGNAYAAKVTLKISHGATETFHMHKAWVKFKELMEKGSNGEIEVQIFPNGQMGHDREALEFTQDGTLDVTSPTVSVLSGWDKAFATSEIPYLFADRETAMAAFNGPYGEFLDQRAQKLGLKVIGWSENGFRHISNSKRPITKPDDMKGLKIRTMQVDLHLETFKHLGANPTPMAFGEVYSALQQGVVDGQENPLIRLITERFMEVQKYASTTSHVYSMHILPMNLAKYESLSDEHKKLLADSMKQALEYQMEIIKKEDAEVIDQLRKGGLTVDVLTPEQIEVFREKVKEIYPKLRDMVDPEAFDLLVKTIADIEAKKK